MIVGVARTVANKAQALKELEMTSSRVKNMANRFFATHVIKKPGSDGSYSIRSRQAYADLVAQDRAFDDLLKEMRRHRATLKTEAARAVATEAIEKVKSARPPRARDTDISFTAARVKDWYRNTVPHGRSSWISNIRFNRKPGTMDVTLNGRRYAGYPERGHFLQWIGQQGPKNGLGTYFNRNIKAR